MAKSHDHRAAEANSRVVSHPAATRQPPARLLQMLWDRWQSFANDQLRQLLLDIDDDLFARADNAESSAMQEMYFNSMRLLRYQSDDIRSRFADAIDASGKVSRQPHEGSEEHDAAGSLEARLEGLSLIEEDVLEQRLAVSTMTQRFERAHTLEVLLAQRRIEALREQLEPGSPAAAISLDARTLAEAFAASLGPLDLDLRVRLVLFKHFENEVMEPIAGLFREFNEMLVRSGILPKLDLSAEVRSRQANETQANATPHSSGEQATVAPRQRMPNEEDGARHSPERPDALGPHSSGGVPLPAGFDLEGAIRRRSALMRKLPGLRQQRRFDQGRDPSELLDVGTVLQLLEASERTALGSWRESDLEQLPERIDFGAFLLEEAERKGRGQAALKGTDEDTVNLLQMLFDLILSDDHLAIPMRALIARLQLPLLRVALVDAGFFSTSHHPARRFLNAISRAGIGWGQAEEKSRDRLYAGIEHLVQRAGSEFKGDTAIFDALRQDLDDLLAAESERIKVAEARVIAREEARLAADRTRRIVTRLIQHRLACAPSLPPPLAGFLRKEWQQVLMRAHGNPEAWQSAFTVLRRLTGSVTGPEGRQLHAALVSGLGQLAVPPKVASSQADEMLSHWAEAEQQAPEEKPTASSTPASAPQVEDPQTELAELTAAATQEDETVSDEVAPGAEAIAAAQALAEESWVELRTRSGKTVRCRLASVTEAPERCIFLNRRGLRIETLSRLELAQAIEQKRLRILDDRQLFDHALEQVIGGLRSAPATAE